MNICNVGHEEVAYSCDTCPACAQAEKTREADEECSAALADVDELRGTIDSLNERLAKVKAGA